MCVDVQLHVHEVLEDSFCLGFKEILHIFPLHRIIWSQDLLSN